MYDFKQAIAATKFQKNQECRNMTNMEKIKLFQEIVNQIQEESRRPMCRLHLSREPFAVTDSHLGGVPYVPHDGQIPTDDDGGQLWLCAQINFAQMPQINGYL